VSTETPSGPQAAIIAFSIRFHAASARGLFSADRGAGSGEAEGIG
jgi:hypothetical protein